MMIRKGVEKEFIGKQFNETLKRISIIEDSIERNEWNSQMEELKIYYRDLYNEIITIEMPVAEIPHPMNIEQTFFSHQDKPENVIVIREEQNAKELHQELIERKSKEKNRRER
jgi:hypothetical protein